MPPKFFAERRSPPCGPRTQLRNPSVWSTKQAYNSYHKCFREWTGVECVHWVITRSASVFLMSRVWAALKLPSKNSPLVLIIQVYKKGELETVQPPCSIIGFMELARSQRVYMELIDTSVDQSNASLSNVSGELRGGGACLTMLVSLQKSSPRATVVWARGLPSVCAFALRSYGWFVNGV